MADSTLVRDNLFQLNVLLWAGLPTGRAARAAGWDGRVSWTRTPVAPEHGQVGSEGRGYGVG